MTEKTFRPLTPTVALRAPPRSSMLLGSSRKYALRRTFRFDPQNQNRKCIVPVKGRRLFDPERLLPCEAHAIARIPDSALARSRASNETCAPFHLVFLAPHVSGNAIRPSASACLAIGLAASHAARRAIRPTSICHRPHKIEHPCLGDSREIESRRAAALVCDAAHTALRLPSLLHGQGT